MSATDRSRIVRVSNVKKIKARKDMKEKFGKCARNPGIKLSNYRQRGSTSSVNEATETNTNTPSEGGRRKREPATEGVLTPNKNWDAIEGSKKIS